MTMRIHSDSSVLGSTEAVHLGTLYLHSPTAVRHLCRAGATGAGGEVEQDSIQRLREHLTAEGAAVCLICLELLQREDPVWSCTDGCYDTVHLACIQVYDAAKRVHFA